MESLECYCAINFVPSNVFACVYMYRLEPIRNNILLAVNQEYIDLSDETVISLHSDDEIAVIPPLSGG